MKHAGSAIVRGRQAPHLIVSQKNRQGRHGESTFTEGWFGFRTVRNHMTIDDFKVYRLARAKE